MKKPSKLVSIILALVLLCSLMAACSSGSDEDATPTATPETSEATDAGDTTKEPVTIEVWSLRPEDDAIYAKIIEDFQTEYDWITVNRTSYSDQTTYYANLAADLEGGKGPDVFDMHPANTYSDYARAGLLLDLSNEKFMDTYYDYAQEISVVDGANYGFMWGYNIICCIYNKDIFTEVGVNEPTNYTELVQAVNDLKAAGYGGIGYPGAAVSGWWFAKAIMLQTGVASGYNELYLGIDDGSIVDVAANAVNAAAVKTAAAWCADGLLYDNTETMALDAELSLFASGQMPIMIMGSWEFGTRDTDFPGIEVGIFPIFNSVDPSANAYYAEGSAIIVANNSGKEAQMEAAKLWINYVASPEVASYYATESCQVSSVQGVQIDFKDGDLLTAAAENVALLPNPAGVNTDYWSTEWQELFRASLFDGTDPDTLLTNYSAVLSTLNLASLG